MISGRDSATAAAIFAKMDEVLQDNEVKWRNCIGVSQPRKKEFHSNSCQGKKSCHIFHGLPMSHSSQYLYESRGEI